RPSAAPLPRAPPVPPYPALFRSHFGDLSLNAPATMAPGQLAQEARVERRIHVVGVVDVVVRQVGEAVLVRGLQLDAVVGVVGGQDRKSTRLNSSHVKISYAVFWL